MSSDDDDMIHKMWQKGEQLMGKPGDGRGGRSARGEFVRPGGGWSRSNRPSHGRSWGGYQPWERSDLGYRLLDQMTQLAEEVVWGAGDLAYRLADLATSFPTPRSLPLPGLSPYPRYDPGPPYGHGQGSGSGSPAAATPTLSLPTVGRGNTAQGGLDLENTSGRPVCDLRLRCSSLVGNDGQTIPGHHLRVDPPVVILPPWGSARVTVMLSVPPEAVPGRYVGLVEDSDDGVQCLVAVTVS